MVERVRAICPRCDGNGYIKVQKKELDCPQCEEKFMHIGGEVITHNGYVMLPKDQTRINIEGGREAIHKKAKKV